MPNITGQLSNASFTSPFPFIAVSGVPLEGQLEAYEEMNARLEELERSAIKEVCRCQWSHSSYFRWNGVKVQVYQGEEYELTY